VATDLTESRLKAEKILEESRKVIYGTSAIRNLKTLFVNTSGDSYTRQTVTKGDGKAPLVERWERIMNEYSIVSPDFLRIISVAASKNSGADSKVQIVTIANTSQIDIKAKVIVNGQKINVGEGFQNFLKNGNGRFGDFGSIFSQKEKPLFSRSAVDLQVSAFTFPLTLTDIFGNAPKFNYLGKADAEGISALVLEAGSNGESRLIEQTKVRRTRYFFDAKSYLLVLVTTEFESENVISSKSIYFSEYKSFGGILIPTKIKEESKLVSKFDVSIGRLKIKPSKTLRVTDITINEFEINREFPKAIFKIKD